jgi:adenylate cyclase
MAEGRAERRLAAILAADVAGYSRLMGADEEGTLATLKTYRRELVDPKIAEHRGRIVKTTGDGVLVEFASAVDAVRCAMELQHAMAERNAAIPADRRIDFRIGINVGDIIIDDGDIYGDGVNVAARLESLAEAGGVCVSGIVSESVGNRIDAVFRDGGEVAIKNIDRPIQVWKWHSNSVLVPVPSVSKSRVKDKAEIEQPSIAVLPFTNMSGDRDQEYFSDGITEDIITDLSKIAGLLVIARNSSFAYKGKSFDIRTFARELGVTSVLEGSVRRTGNRVRITAQLINAANGAHLWAERYDRELTDIFAVQDEVARHIVEALKVKLTSVEEARIGDIPTKSPEAHDLFLRGRHLMFGREWTRDIFDKLVALLTRAVEVDPCYGEAYAGLGFAHIQDFHNRFTESTNSLDVANRFVTIAIEKDPLSPFAHWAAALVALWKKNYERAKQETETALALNPNYAPACGTRGIAEIYSGHPLAAIPFLERAMRLDPALTQQYVHFLGSAYLIAGKYEAAAASFRERIRLAPETDLSRGLLVSTLGHLGEIDEARRLWSELKQVNPKYSFAAHLARMPLSNPADVERIADGFAKTGLSD